MIWDLIFIYFNQVILDNLSGSAAVYQDRVKRGKIWSKSKKAHLVLKLFKDRQIVEYIADSRNRFELQYFSQFRRDESTASSKVEIR